MEFFQNVFIEFAEFSDKICMHMYVCYYSTSKTHVSEGNFKLIAILASIIISFPEYSEFTESYTPFRKNSIANDQIDRFSLLLQELVGLYFWLNNKVCYASTDQAKSYTVERKDLQNWVNSGIQSIM